MRGPEAAAGSVRVLHIAQTTAGGIATFLEEIAGFQAERLGRGNVAILIPSGALHCPRLDPTLIRTFGSASRKPIALLRFARSAHAAIQQFKPDIIHLHSTFAGAIVRALLALRRKRPLIVYTPNGWAFSMEIADRRKRAYAAVERRLSAVTDLIHNVSQSEQTLAIACGLAAAKMRVIPSGIGWSPALDRKKRSGPLRFLFIGRHDRQKGLDYLLETIERHPLRSVHFDIVGSGILSGGVADRPKFEEVTFHGWLPRDETLALLDHADALIMPSRWEAFGFVAVEAMRAGIPVIGSNRGAIPEVVGEGLGGRIFDLDDPDSLGRLLRQLGREELERLGSSARMRFENNYSADQMNSAICDAYDAVLKGKLSSPGRASGVVTQPAREGKLPA